MNESEIFNDFVEGMKEVKKEASRCIETLTNLQKELFEFEIANGECFEEKRF